jgi:hypothetical protein
MNTQENNKLIAEFMVRDKEVDFHTTEEIKEGFREEATWYALDGGWVKDDELQYHKSWDWLMPVVDKMNTTELWDEYDISYLATYLVSVDINATYNAVVEFINQYNENKWEYKTCDRCSYDILDEEGDVLEHHCIDDELYQPKQ